MKTRSLLVMLFGLLFGWSGSAFSETVYPDTVPVAGNTYLTVPAGRAALSDRGTMRWDNDQAVFSTYFKTDRAGKLTLALRGKAGGTCTLQFTAGGKNFRVKMAGDEPAVYPIGTIKLREPGYVKVDFRGLEREGKGFPQLECFLLKGSATEGTINCVKGFSTYWGRRGPSVHMNYELPKENIQYFYNEVTVPEGEDVMHAYFMAAGFGEGYFGMQVNSPTERRILFSVWSPFQTDDPSSIPPEKRIVKLRQGAGVHIGEFGNEGSGGQSFLVYPWKAGQTYKFLAEVKPDGRNNTVYTAYFYAPDDNRWHLIASFKRPETNTYYTHAHSFLENFNPAQGYLPRKVYFGNQWARTSDGRWIELTKGTFTCDATGNAGVRKDFAGGVENGRFFLKNCGFFNETTPYRSRFERPAQGNIPQIDWDELEKL